VHVTLADEAKRRQRIAATGFLRDGSHYKGTYEVWKCPLCGERMHVGRLQMPDELESHLARVHSAAVNR
jgi:hypothetical protein